MAHYLFNFAGAPPRRREEAADFLRAGLWGVDDSEPHRDSLAAGDLVLIYLAAPEQTFVGRAELASGVHPWTPSETYPGAADAGVVLAHVEEWEPPVPMSAVLAQMGPTEKAKAEFERGVVRITEGEYDTAVAVAASTS